MYREGLGVGHDGVARVYDRGIGKCTAGIDAEFESHRGCIDGVH
ncbi:MAG: hypothetical protein MAG794_00940 [Gammaproteobacteria bacterium]|nr:hypothetical protein [Gammaproteobacteria bacterium]